MPFEPLSPTKLPSKIHRKVEEGLDFILMVTKVNVPLNRSGDDYY
jgi:hypothetical protein